MVIEKIKSNDSIKSIINFLRKKGVYGEYMIKNKDIESFLKDFIDLLEIIGFKIYFLSFTQDDAQLQAIYGKKLKTFLISRLPGGRLFRSGTRQGVELNLTRCNNDLGVKLLVVPYSEIFDSSESLFLTQDVLEKIFDEKYNLEKWDLIMDGLKNKKIELIPGIPKEFETLNENSPFTYYPKSNKYDYSQNTICPKCGYEFTANLMLKSKYERKGEVRCKKCSNKFNINIETKPPTYPEYSKL